MRHSYATQGQICYCLALIDGTMHDQHQIGNILVFIYNVRRVAAKLARTCKIDDNLIL